MASLEVSQWIFRLQFLKTSKCTAEKGKFIAKFVTERFPLHWAKMPTPWNLKVSSALNQSVKKGQNYTKVQRYMYNSPWTEHQIFLLLCNKILSANSLTDMIEGNGFINNWCLTLQPIRVTGIKFLLTIAPWNQTWRSREDRKWSRTKEALDS